MDWLQVTNDLVTLGLVRLELVFLRKVTLGLVTLGLAALGLVTLKLVALGWIILGLATWAVLCEDWGQESPLTWPGLGPGLRRCLPSCGGRVSVDQGARSPDLLNH